LFTTTKLSVGFFGLRNAEQSGFGTVWVREMVRLAFSLWVGVLGLLFRGIRCLERDQQKEIVEKVETILELNRCQLIIEDVFDGLLKKYGFSDSKPLFHFYPQHPSEVKIDVVNSQNFEEPEEFSKIYTTLSSNFIVITDNNKNLYTKSASTIM